MNSFVCMVVVVAAVIVGEDVIEDERVPGVCWSVLLLLPFCICVGCAEGCDEVTLMLNF